MLKRLAILAFLNALATVSLLAGQTAPLSPPEEWIAKTDSGQDGKAQTHPQSGNQATPNTVPTTPKPATPTCDEACQQSRRNLEIQGNLEWFTGVLAVVGVLQILTMVWQAWLLKQTRGDVHTQANWMKTQAGYMKDQTKILGKSVAAAQSSADAAKDQIQMVKDKERARLEIEIDEFIFKPNIKPFFLQKVNWRVRLHGQSEAFIIKKRMIACIGEPDEHPMFNFGVYEMAIRDVITPSERFAYGSCMISPTSATIDDVGGLDLNSLKEKKAILYCAGHITFKDVFGDTWTLPFKRRWAYELFGSNQIDAKGWGGE